MGKFRFLGTGIPGLTVIEPTVFGDDRGFFMEVYHEGEFDQAGYTMRFVQDNHSRSKRGVLRGMHMQVEQPQGKLVRVIQGEVYDVALDCRPDSPTLGAWYGVSLSAENKRMFWVPEGFAHGFLVMSDMAEFVYKCTNLYAPQDELGIRFDDPQIGIEWPDCGCEILLSEKDRKHPSFEEAMNVIRNSKRIKGENR